MKIETTYIEPNKKFMQYTPVPFNSKFSNFLFSQLLLQPRKCKLKFEKYWFYFFMAGGVISCLLLLSDTHKHLLIWKISHHHSSDYMSSIDGKILPRHYCRSCTFLVVKLHSFWRILSSVAILESMYYALAKTFHALLKFASSFIL